MGEANEVEYRRVEMTSPLNKGSGYGVWSITRVGGGLVVDWWWRADTRVVVGYCPD